MEPNKLFIELKEIVRKVLGFNGLLNNEVGCHCFGHNSFMHSLSKIKIKIKIRWSPKDPKEDFKCCE